MAGPAAQLDEAKRFAEIVEPISQTAGCVSGHP